MRKGVSKYWQLTGVSGARYRRRWRRMMSAHNREAGLTHNGKARHRGEYHRYLQLDHLPEKVRRNERLKLWRKRRTDAGLTQRGTARRLTFHPELRGMSKRDRWREYSRLRRASLPAPSQLELAWRALCAQMDTP